MLRRETAVSLDSHKIIAENNPIDADSIQISTYNICKIDWNLHAKSGVSHFFLCADRLGIL